MKMLFSGVIAVALTGSVFAGAALAPKTVADFKGYVGSIKNISNGICVNTQGKYVLLETKKRIAVDLKKKYQVSFEYRIAPGGKGLNRFYFAVACFDKKGRVVSAVSQNCAAGTDTVLAAAAAKGAKVVKIKNGAKWTLKYGTVAFNAKADYSDLPNFDTADITAIKKVGDVWEISLKKPLAKAYPAGTPVREQHYGATYRYMLAGTVPQAQWKKFSRVVSGAARIGASGANSKWRPGTASVGIVIMFFSGKPSDVEFRNISITEVK